MKKNLLLTLSVSMLSIGSMLHAQFNASGTDYSNALAVQEKWSEDRANEFVSMPNSFACIIANSGGDANPNGKWTALIDEAACGLAESDAKTSAIVYSKAAMQSSRASNISAQEVTAWFNAQGGARYIADVTLKQGADTLPPFGEWYFAFYKAGSLSGSTWTTYTKDDANEFGYVDIAQSGNDIAILVATEMLMEQNMGGFTGVIDDETYAKVLFVGGSSDNTKFVGSTNNVVTNKATGIDTGMGTGYSMLAGATSATHYYSININQAGTLDTTTEQCFDRSQKFQTTHQASLYNATTGEKVNISGAFGFQLADNTRGYLGSWGVWIDGGQTKFTTSTRELAITTDDGDNYTLKWAPGKLESQTFTSQDLADGDKFDFYYNEGNKEVDAVWDATNSRFNLFNRGTTTSAGTLSTTQWDRWMWSNTKNKSVRWKGGTTIDIENRKDLTFSTTFAGQASTKFYSKHQYLQHTKASALPYTWSDFSTNGSSNWWDADTGSGGTNGVRKTYFLTGSAPGGSLEANTLYLDNGDDTLTTADARVRFDFGVDDRQSTYTNYSDGTTGTYSSNDWPAGDVTLVLASEADTAGDTCDKAGNDFSGCDTYRWQFGAMPWDNSVAAHQADGSLVAIDDPIIIDYTYAATDDRNNGMTISLRSKDPYNPLTGCTDIQDQGGNTQSDPLDADTKYGVTCSNVNPASFAGEKFLLEFDGQEIQGIPGFEICTDDLCQGFTYYTRLVNLKDGTELTDTKGNKYVFLASGVSSAFQPAAGGVNDCSAIKFSSLADLGIAASDLPGSINRSSTDYPLPSSAWADAPTTSSCTVTMGDTSNCN